VAEPFDDAEMDAIRSVTPGCRDELIHLNHAGSSLPPQAVLDAQIAHLHREATIGGYEAAMEAADRDEAVYDSIATMLGAGRRDIARFEHATAAWNAAFWSLPFRRGQRIITHDHDYGANAVAYLHAAALHDLTIERLPNDPSGAVDVEALAEWLGEPDEVAVVSLAWIPTNGGLINPAAAVGAVTRAAGVPFLLDGCQAVGQLAIDVDEIACDFLSGTGRKYLRGPRGTGLLYVRPSILDRIVPAQPDHHGADWTTLDTYEFAPGATRFEHWEYSHANWLGLGAAVDEALRLGLDRIQATVTRRGDDLRARLVDLGMTVHDEGRATCGIVTASHPFVDATSLSEQLRARGINTSVTHIGSSRFDVERRGLPPMLRLSVHCTTTTDELDRTVATLADLTH
jgi:selenocysteine lyase/cysteine desulfurase